MGKTRWAVLTLLILASGYLSGCAALSRQTVLEQAIDLLEKQHINSERVDWRTLSQEAKALESQRDTRIAIEFVIRRLGEQHTFYLAPDHPNLKAISDTREDAVKPVVDALAGKVDRTIAVLSIPAFGFGPDHPATKRFIEKAGSEIDRLAKAQPKAWIIDLRENGGGNMWPMLAGLACFFEPGVLGYFRDRHNIDVPWFMDDNYNVGVKSRWFFHSVSKQSLPCPAGLGKRSLVVLIGSKTASSGEAVAIALLGRANTVLYGNTSAGFATGNIFERLRDGSALAITSTTMRDLNGRAFPDGINPRELTEKEGRVSMMENDIEIAINELLSQKK